MFNVGGGEVLVILLLALIVLGPTKLPEVARQVGRVMNTMRSLSNGFQDEMKRAMEDPIEAAARDRGQKLVASEQNPAPADSKEDDAAGGAPTVYPTPGSAEVAAEPQAEPPADGPAIDPNGSGTADPAVSTAASAGMYQVDSAADVADEPAKPVHPTTSDSPELVRNPFRQDPPVQ